MSADIKSGEEILAEFFTGLSDVKGLDEDTVNCIVDLYNTGKLTDKNIANGLAELRKIDDDED